ncbi:MAG TPA: outer membrane protein transport protein [Thermoanaerobaculia bacterium]|nr:outer membrane protein transport protein [Thermoanaerobaculia bacterium]
MPKRLLVLGACAVMALLLVPPAPAGNGHLLHGVGAVNSSLGGSGTGQPFEVLGALHSNPALLTQLDDFKVGISAEVFTDDLSVTTTNGAGAKHTTDSGGEPGVLPALGWSYHRPGAKTAVGFGLLAVAGFRTNFPADSASLLLAPPPAGFGRLATDLAITKIPLAVAWEVNPQLSLGASLNLYQGSLVIQPLPVVTPDCFPAVPPLSAHPERCFRPGTSGQVASYALGLQLGLYYEINPAWSLGFSYTTEQDFYDYKWNSNHANPNITVGPNAFGAPRRVGIDIDGPPIASLGIGWRPNPQWKVALDGRWVGYKGTEGIGGNGGINQDLQLVSIGWQDILIGMLGAELQVNPNLRLRGGLNFNESPIEPALTLNSGGTPSVFEQHYTLGASLAVHPNLDLDFGFYYTPENEKTGPIVTGPGTQLPAPVDITLRNSIVSGLAAFSFHF